MAPAIFDHVMANDLQKFGLSPREAEVLFWVMRGNSNAEVGTILDIAAPTVKKHLERVFRKLGVKTRMAATIAIIESLQNPKRRSTSRYS